MDELNTPTMSDGETIEALRAEQIDAVSAGKRSMSFGRIDQLAIEHILGAR